VRDLNPPPIVDHLINDLVGDLNPFGKEKIRLLTSFFFPLSSLIEHPRFYFEIDLTVE
jgi:hypothetical protein